MGVDNIVLWSISCVTTYLYPKPVRFGPPFRSLRVSKRKYPEQLSRAHHQWVNVKDVLMTDPLKIFA